jgi:hypothetical protein
MNLKIIILELIINNLNLKINIKKILLKKEKKNNQNNIIINIIYHKFKIILIQNINFLLKINYIINNYKI